MSRQKHVPFWYPIPLGALLLFLTMSFSTGGRDILAADGPAVSGAFTMYIRMAIYLLAAFACFSEVVRFPSRLFSKFILIVMIAYVLLTSLWSHNPTLIYLSIVHAAGVVFVTYAAAIYFSSNMRAIIPFLAGVLGVSNLVSLGTVFLLPEIGLGLDEWDPAVERWQGATGNANAYGLLAALGVWVSVAALLFGKSASRYGTVLYALILVVSAVGLWGTESRTSQIVALLSVSITLGARYLIRKNGRVVYRNLGFLFYFSVVVCCIVILVVPEFSDKSATEALGRDSDLSGRTGMWDGAKRLISKKPIAGWSFDARESAHQSGLSGFGNGHFHNGYYDVLVQGGVIGFSIVMSLYLVTLRRVYRLSKRYPRQFVPFLALLAASLVYNLTEVSFLGWSNLLWVLFIFVYFIAFRPELRRKKRRNRLRQT